MQHVRHLPRQLHHFQALNAPLQALQAARHARALTHLKPSSEKTVWNKTKQHKQHSTPIRRASPRVQEHTLLPHGHGAQQCEQ